MPTLPIIPEFNFDYPDNINRIDVLPNTDEGLTGFVKGLKASDIEERFARALDKAQIPYDFQVSYLAPRNMSGEYRLDFLLYIDGTLQPVAIDGEYAHKSPAQHRKDDWKDDQFNEAKHGTMQPVQRITFEELVDQDMAETLVMERFSWLR